MARPSVCVGAGGFFISIGEKIMANVDVGYWTERESDFWDRQNDWNELAEMERAFDPNKPEVEWED